MSPPPFSTPLPVISNQARSMAEQLNPNDVLLGKGTGYYEYTGNKRFHVLVEERKEAYNSAKKNMTKSKLAKELLEHIHSLGGRFLKRRADNTNPARFVVENGVYYEVDEKTALDKIKQAFRQNRDYRRFQNKKKEKQGDNANSSQEHVNGADQESITDGVPESSSVASIGGSNVSDGNVPAPSAAIEGVTGDSQPLLPLITRTSAGSPTVDYSNLLGLQGSQSALSPSFGLRQLAEVSAGQTKGMNHSLGQTPQLAQQNLMGYSRNLADSTVRFQAATVSDLQEEASPEKRAEESFKKADTRPVTSTNSQPEESSSTASLDENDAAYVLYALGLADKPKITEEELKQEQSTLTDNEQAAAIADVFGKKCSLGKHKSKKVRSDFDNKDTVDFLVGQMKEEIDLIPLDKKQGLVEAQKKCRREDEFGDARLMMFLRAEGMNAKLAAQRFVRYWESRLQLFGPDKFHLRMTLSEALCDDIAAIKAGMVSILPHPDLSGRPLCVIEPPRNTGKGYTAESMVRALWYLMEIIVREHDGIFIRILWDKDSTVWNYDQIIITHVPYYRRYCWPLREYALHSCCSNAFVRRIVKPMLIATIDKKGRGRTVIHDVPANEILDALAEYGINDHMLPTSMGGLVDIDEWMVEFIAQRRAIEMEAI